jgi:uncharacterized short protein YbdD (DUF466 family)
MFSNLDIFVTFTDEYTRHLKHETPDNIDLTLEEYLDDLKVYIETQIRPRTKREE